MEFISKDPKIYASNCMAFSKGKENNSEEVEAGNISKAMDSGRDRNVRSRSSVGVPSLIVAIKEPCVGP